MLVRGCELPDGELLSLPADAENNALCLGLRGGVFFCAMIPFIELRGSIILGASLGIPWWQNFIISVLGNMLPVPFIL